MRACVIVPVVALCCLLSFGPGRAVAAGLPAIGYQQAFASVSSAYPEALIDPEGSEATCEAQYVSEAMFNASGWDSPSTQPCSQGLGSGSSEVDAEAQIEGLSIATTYHYRFLASNGVGTTTGPEGTFVTFGLESFSFGAVDEGGGSFTQAGGHPYALTTRFELKTNDGRYEKPLGGLHTVNETATLKDVKAQLPPGLVGAPTATSTCTRLDAERFDCEPDDQVGVMELETATGEVYENVPLFNLVPPKGVAAYFGARFNNFVNAFIEAHVRTGEDYGVDANSLNITPIAPLKWVSITFWGVPAAPAHTPLRACPNNGGSYNAGCPSGEPERPFLSMPSACEGALEATLQADAYQQEGAWVNAGTQVPGTRECGSVPFAPQLHAQATTPAGDSPSGLNLDIHVPQSQEPSGRTSADLKSAMVTLPAGMVVDPSSADGLESCSEQQTGFKGFSELEPVSEPGVRTAQFTPEPAECPDGSKLGTVTIHTPLLEHPLEGGMYLATPHENPFGSLIALYLAVYDPISGVVVKLPGRVEANPSTGQLTAVFDQNPQLPFEDLEVSLFNGSRASLTTPLACGAYSVSGTLEPWSHKGASGEEGTPDATPSSEPFQVSEGCAGQEGEAPNKPSFEAGTASPIAGSYSPFVLKLSREDGSQRFSALNVTLPPGLLGKVAGVEQCPQADIEKAESRSHEGEGALEQSSPSCPSGSEVGTVHVGAGSGAPYYVTGKAYFAGPYEGAPFSLVIVTPALAGPFDLGTVVVRAGLYINPHTAQVTVKSDPFPTILDGIPLDIRSVGVEINRHEFTLNPTSCEAMSVSGEEQSTAGQTASLSSRFKAEGCTNLPFHPSFTASTQGSTSKANGASLTVKVNPLPGQANIAKVDLTLPKQLPARLTTLQKACTEAQFNANPAGCPEASDIGTAVARTPILSSPLQGPAYLVSHGGAAFPDVEFVLQGENGVEIVLDGGTQIKDGITYSKFETVPDAPITSFETVLPEGPHSVLATDIPASAKYSLCGQSLQMPTTITGQNGVVVNQTTNIAVTGCKAVKTKPLTRAQKLAAALKKCRTKYKARKRRSKRVACEKAARKRFGPKAKAKSKRGKTGGKKKG